KAEFDKANAGYEKLVAEGNFPKLLEQIITSTKKYTSEERKQKAFENLIKIITDVAATDPDRVGAVLLGMAEAYQEAADKFEKADKGIGKRIAAAISDRLQLERNMYKDHLQEMKILQGEEIKEIDHLNKMKDIAERAFTAQLQATIEERTWVLETFYKEGISDVKDYYDEKQKLLEMSFANELKIIQAQTERAREEYEKQQDDLLKQGISISGRMIKIKQDILGVLKSQGVGASLMDTLLGGDLVAAGQAYIKIPENYRDIVKAQVKEYGDWENEIRKLAAAYPDLQNKIEELIAEGILKETEAINKQTEALRKLDYEKQIALALEPYEKQKLITEQQSEYNKLMIEANELAGNWSEAEEYKLKLLENETTLAQLAIDSRIVEVKQKIEILTKEAEMLAIKIQLASVEEELIGFQSEALGLSKERYENLLKMIAALKNEVPLLEDVSKATAILGSEELADQQLKMADSIGYALKKVNDEWRDHAKYVRELTDDLYRDSAKSFSDLFYDSITGKLKSLTDYFKNFCNSILRYFTDMLGRMAAQNLQQAVMGQGTGILNRITGAFGFGKTPSGAGSFLPVGALGYYGGYGAQQTPGYYGWAPNEGSAIPPSKSGFGLGATPGSATSILGYAGAGYGAYSMYQQMQAGTLTPASGALQGAAYGTMVFPGIGTIIGAVVGLIAGLFGGGKKTTPQMELRYGYEPGIKHMEPTGAYGDSRWQTTMGMYGFWTKKMGAESEAFGESVIVAFKKMREGTKETLENLGLDVSGFNKEWYKWIDGLEDMTAEQVQEALKNMMTDYIAFASGLDFEKFRKEGEKVADTIDLMITAMASIASIVKPKWDETTKSG
ncbi:MAG: hypothetical protein KKA68_21340, partial [Gammaproteobacteria bacterium]|nr:hypothetical protein [Gammaproteobacteria bacterium]